MISVYAIRGQSKKINQTYEVDLGTFQVEDGKVIKVDPLFYYLTGLEESKAVKKLKDKGFIIKHLVNSFGKPRKSEQ